MPRAATFALTCAAAGLLAGCDVEPGSVFEYDTVARVDVSALRSSPWAKDAFNADNVQLSIDGNKGCEALVTTTNTVTLGASNGRYEAYVEGSFDAKAVDACLDALEADFAKSTREPTEEDDPPTELHTHKLGKGAFAVVLGPAPLPTPSRARLSALLDADPSPSGMPIWFTARPDASNNDIRYVEGWMNPDKGLDAHLALEFGDEATAAKVGAEATMFLTAMKFSDDAAAVARAVDLQTSGNTINAEVHASTETMKALVESSVIRTRDEVPAHVRKKAEERAKEKAKGRHGVSFSFDTSVDTNPK